MISKCFRRPSPGEGGPSPASRVLYAAGTLAAVLFGAAPSLAVAQAPVGFSALGPAAGSAGLSVAPAAAGGAAGMAGSAVPGAGGSAVPGAPVANVIRNGSGGSGATEGEARAGGANDAPGGDKAASDAASKASAIRDAAADMNEFQRFVAASTGRVLPIFGMGLFSSPSTFAPLENVPVSPEYTLGPGDEVVIRAWGAVDIDYRAVVDRNGLISIPRIGTVSLAGVKVANLEGVVRAQVARTYTNFNLDVTMGRLRSVQVYVVGQARRPGAYTVSSLSTLVNAVFASGGPAANGSLRDVQLRRGGQVIAHLDLYAFITRGEAAGDTRLLPGDVIVIPPAGPRVALLGALDTPAIYEMKPGGESLQEMLAVGGGTLVLTTPHRALLERLDPREPRAPRRVEDLALDAAGRASRLRDGDIVTLLSVANRFANAVTLRGNVAAPLRYPYREGMTLADLIPDPEALITPDYFQRKNVLVQFESGQSTSLERTAGETRRLFDEVNWTYASIERLDPKTLTPQLTPFNLGRLVLDKDPVANLPLLPGDVVTVYGRNDMRMPAARTTRLVRIEGEVAAPGLYPLEPGETLRQLVQRVGGLTPQAYVFGTELARESVRAEQKTRLAGLLRKLEDELASEVLDASQNVRGTGSDTAAVQALQMRVQMQQQAQQRQLERLRTLQPTGRIALELDPRADSAQALPDVPLEDGDRIVVPTRPAFVAAVGAVLSDNPLLWKPQRTAGELLQSVGVARAADPENAFVLRADGTVLSRSTKAESWLGGGWRAVALMPGDTLVVPEKADRRTTLTRFTDGLRDWTQILAQFGLGAAAIKVLRN